MRADLTDIVLVVDRSGSMEPLASDTIGGFNTFIKEQRELPGEALVSLCLFNTSVDFPYWGRPLGEVPALDATTYKPLGGTAMSDAIALSIQKRGAELAAMPEADRPSKVAVVVMTDGYENASREYRGPEGLKRVAEMVKHQEEAYNWQFLFLGSGIDPSKVAAGYGMASSAGFAATGQGTRNTYSLTSRSIGAYRSGGKTLKVTLP